MNIFNTNFGVWHFGKCGCITLVSAQRSGRNGIDLVLVWILSDKIGEKALCCARILYADPLFRNRTFDDRCSFAASYDDIYRRNVCYGEFAGKIGRSLTYKLLAAQEHLEADAEKFAEKQLRTMEWIRCFPLKRVLIAGIWIFCPVMGFWES